MVALTDVPELVIGVIGNWGTGLADAKWLLSELMRKNPQLLIHLGDIYYAGTVDENRANFLDIIVDAIAPGIPVFTMPGNHDVYSGGEPVYGLLSQLNNTTALKAHQRDASYFCLRSANWQVSAIDTGLYDCDPFTVETNLTFLDPLEAAWHPDKLKTTNCLRICRRIRERAGGQRTDAIAGARFPV